MRCDEADDLIDAFAENALDDAQRSSFVAHIGDCARCRLAVEASRRLSVSLAALPRLAPSAAADARALAAVDEERAWAASRARWRRVLVAWGAAAAFAAVAVAVFVATPAIAWAADLAPRLVNVAVGWLRWRAAPALAESRGALVATLVVLVAIAALDLAISRWTPARQRAR